MKVYRNITLLSIFLLTINCKSIPSQQQTSLKADSSINTTEMSNEIIENEINYLSMRVHNFTPNSINILSVEEMIQDGDSLIYRINAEIDMKGSKGEQTYQMRYPAQNDKKFSNFFTTSYINNQKAQAKDVNISEKELSLMIQRAADAGIAHVMSNPDWAKLVQWVDSRQIGEKNGTPGSIIFSVQIGMIGSPVPLDRKINVERGTYQTKVDFFE